MNVVIQKVHKDDAVNRVGFGSAVLWTVVALVIYALSSGPAMWLHAKITNPNVTTTVYRVYTPVVLLINKTPLNGVGAWWVYEWVDVPESRAWLLPE